ncbi:hypothetical protein E2C01_057668 [Portunus trituberculatus]|uniref:Uncharacterized protein n=1 Tax=Portunus trituberculatus TaxID=210409 RepID=A0A5B7H0Z6_PORTR|nr:hypothetical protein [Portunus trituberculatus]
MPKAKERSQEGCAPVGILEEHVWEVLFSFRPLVTQAILLIVVPILEPISPPKLIFGVTTWNLGIMVTCNFKPLDKWHSFKAVCGGIRT